MIKPLALFAIFLFGLTFAAGALAAGAAAVDGKAADPSFRFTVQVGDKTTVFKIWSLRSKTHFEARTPGKHKSGVINAEDTEFIKRKISRLLAHPENHTTVCGRSHLKLEVQQPTANEFTACLGEKTDTSKTLTDLANGLSILIE